MKALTVWQPWASLIASGCKLYEFRGWLPPAELWGKRIAIHAASRKVNFKEVRDELFGVDDACDAGIYTADAADFLKHTQLPDYPLGRFLCTVELGTPVCANIFSMHTDGDALVDCKGGGFNYAEIIK